jgi:hypothetical protein
MCATLIAAVGLVRAAPSRRFPFGAPTWSREFVAATPDIKQFSSEGWEVGVGSLALMGPCCSFAGVVIDREEIFCVPRWPGQILNRFQA